MFDLVQQQALLQRTNLNGTVDISDARMEAMKLLAKLEQKASPALNKLQQFAVEQNRLLEKSKSDRRPSMEERGLPTTEEIFDYADKLIKQIEGG